jgi:hypothetical protein
MNSVGFWSKCTEKCLKASNNKETQMKNVVEQFDDWYNTVGTRTFAEGHGSADGHRQYMKIAFLDGYHLAFKFFEKIIIDSNDSWLPEDEYND